MILKWWIYIIKNLSKSTEYRTLKVNPNAHYGFWVIKMYLCMFIICKNCTTLDVDNGRGYACMGTGDIWEITVLSAHYFSKSKIALKN